MLQPTNGGGFQHPPPAPLPQAPMQPPQWGMIPPPVPSQQHYQQQPHQPPAVWNQQPSQIPPPVPQAAPVPYYGAQTGAPAAAQNPDEVRTLWIGDLQYWMDENYVYGCFAQTGEVLSVKLIRDKQTGQIQGYGFIEFATRAMAEAVLQAYTGQMMPSAEQIFRLNWASAGEKRDDGPDYTIFVGDLSADVTDYVLQETFRNHYSSVKGAKVVTDKATGRSKGYGFVRFSDPTEQNRAMNEMNGMFCSSRPMRTGPAASKKSVPVQQGSVAQGVPSDDDPENTTIFVGGLESNVSEETVRQVFLPFGELIHVKIPIGKRCGFVQFQNRSAAEEALRALQGTLIGGQSVRLSWGRSPSNKSAPQDTNQWAGSNYYGYGQGYDAYGYAQPTQDQNMHAYGTYSGYPNYQQQQ